MTLRAQYAVALMAIGFRPASTRSRKYDAFTRTDRDGRTRWVWLGAAGAVRSSFAPAIGSSVPVADAERRALLDVARALSAGARRADYDARHGARADGLPPSDADPETGVQYGEVA